MTRGFRLPGLSRLFLAAALAALAVLFVNHAPPASAEHTGKRTVWSATMTVGTFSSVLIGFDADSGNGALSDRNFTYGGENYSIRELFFQPSDRSLNFGFSVGDQAALKQPELTMHVGNSLSDLRQFALADAMTAGTALFWTNSGLSWEEGDTVRLWLTVDLSALNLPTLTASFSPEGPVNEDWETNSAHDLWSPTLTVQDLSTPASAPANRGCDDSDSSALCSSALTDNDFTFKGVDYTVKAISYNQRKVASDTNTLTVKTYEESLKLTLDKAIPESLQSCLTLYAGNAKVPFADDGLDRAGVDAKLSDSDRTITLTEFSGNAWGMNWSAGDTVELRLPNVGCLTLTLSEAVDEETSLQWRRGGTADSSDYQRISLPTFAAGTTTASTPVKPVDDGSAEGCETIILDMTMWPGTVRAVHESFTVYIEDGDGGTPCIVLQAQDGVPGLQVLEAPTDYVVPGYTKPDASSGTAGTVGDDDAGSQPPDPPNSAPTVAAPLADVIEPVVGGGRQIDLSGVFADADGDALAYSASTTNEDISFAFVQSSELLVVALGRGTVTITVTADDGNGGAVSDSFTVTVKEAPTVASPIADISELEAGASHQVSLSGVFADADGDALTYSAASSDTAVATATVGNGSLTVTAQQAGTATITVTAQDADGNQVSDTFDVTVIASPEPQVEAPASSSGEEPDAVARYDANQDGVISLSEYRAAVANLGKDVTLDELVRIRQAWVDGGHQQ